MATPYGSLLSSSRSSLRNGALGVVIGEVAHFNMTASRRVHLTARGTGTIGFVLRRWRRMPDAADFGIPIASMARWWVSSVPPAPIPVLGIARARWLLEMIRVRQH